MKYTFIIEVCNYAGCANTSVEHDTTNWHCGPEDDHKVKLFLSQQQFKYSTSLLQKITTDKICNSKPDCPIGKRDEQELICQGSPFARNISLTIFLYMFLVLLLFALVKKKEYFKCTKHSHKQQDIAAIATEVSYLRSLMVDKSGIEFKVFYFIMKLFS